MSTIFPHQLTLGRVAIRSDQAVERDLQNQWRWRLTQALGRVTFRSPMPPRAILMVQRLPDPCPGALLSNNAWSSVHAWEDEVESQISNCWRRAVRPAVQAVPPSADTVWFADEAEYLACLSWDLHQEAATQRWWWHTWLRDHPYRGAENSIFRLWQPAARWLPQTIEVLLQQHGIALQPLLARLTPDHASELGHLVAQAYRLPQATLRESTIITLGAALPASVRAIKQGLSQPAYVLATLCLAAIYAPGALQRERRRESAGFTHQGPGMPPSRLSDAAGSDTGAGQPDAGPAADANNQGEVPLGDDSAPSSAMGAGASLVVGASAAGARYPSDGSQNINPAPSGTVDDRPHQPSGGVVSPARPGEGGPRWDGPGQENSGLSESGDEKAPGGLALESPTFRKAPASEDSAASHPDPLVDTGDYLAEDPAGSWALKGEQETLTLVGGLWYLVNALNDLQWLTGETEPDAWHKLLFLAQALAPEVRHDPVWDLLDSLGEERVSEEISVAWTAQSLPIVQHYLAEGLEESDAAADIIREAARLYVTRTHIDVVFSLDQVRLSVRKAGLDRNPSWVPELAHVITFYFE